MQFVTRAELRSFAASKSVSEQASIRKSAASQTLVGSTFLSHSSKDEDLVVGATIVLENHGARVYTDEIDPEMPPYTSEETARLLKSRINQTKRFVLLTSKNSKESRWVPWELGIADGYKGLYPIALFPSSDNANDMSWASWEYLGLYQQILWGQIKGRKEKEWIVLNREEFSAVTLRDWLSSN
ncbi:toll/interleukin-1 receptor domain-containing protein [Sinorhizobium medicae]|uniref:toll/interleukin-1 receptor domain-containing protein n=1 Tax=Sinorhizobium medicae TaxID=110321 RepID=UPI002AF6B42C|nr:toll/interleukin-1 receptor domain-containing protein [Sinorhizobium medicae]WQO48664.1 toll/interleukin-1 receptor domain-containing protein [Sinorhizobium medicae]WQO68912.1 toll/interleukin-1 receptor domain-containing protein [Sinorhizobium medicae]WQO77587.1 toll/interleukin-1 receptor domain-containing protein [Sinorhizobium medicae]